MVFFFFQLSAIRESGHSPSWSIRLLKVEKQNLYKSLHSLSANDSVNSSHSRESGGERPRTSGPQRIQRSTELRWWRVTASAVGHAESPCSLKAPACCLPPISLYFSVKGETPCPSSWPVLNALWFFLVLLSFVSQADLRWNQES